MFLHGLADRVQREAYMLDLPPHLNGLIDLALWVDARINQLDQHVHSIRTHGGAGPRGGGEENTVGPIDHEPMQVGRAADTSYTCAR